MKYQDYLQFARSVESPYEKARVTLQALPDINGARLVHVGLGLATEALELLESIALKKHVPEQLMELSDLAWFSAIACDTLGVEITDDEIANNPMPTSGPYTLAGRCEMFASRVKAALCYGNPRKPGDPDPDFWRQLPKAIFLHALAIGAKHGGPTYIMEINVSKLQARYPERKFTETAAVVRNEAAETQAVVAPQTVLAPEIMAALTAIQK